VPVVVLALAFAALAGVFVFARPQYRDPSPDATIKLPDRKPAVDAAGAAGWVWPEGVPGWRPEERFQDYNPSGLQSVELATARLAAARAALDADDVRVLASTRPNKQGVLAILAAPTLYRSPVETCLAAVLQSGPVVWQCPGAATSGDDLASAHVLLAAAGFRAPGELRGRRSLYLVGVARGDVSRVVLDGMGEIYTRGKTWGEFDAALTVPVDGSRLSVYGRGGLLETVPLRLAPGQQRVLR
jgi:hypothetical protein